MFVPLLARFTPPPKHTHSFFGSHRILRRARVINITPRPSHRPSNHPCAPHRIADRFSFTPRTCPPPEPFHFRDLNRHLIFSLYSIFELFIIRFTRVNNTVRLSLYYINIFQEERLRRKVEYYYYYYYSRIAVIIMNLYFRFKYGDFFFFIRTREDGDTRLNVISYLATLLLMGRLNYLRNAISTKVKRELFSRFSAHLTCNRFSARAAFG